MLSSLRASLALMSRRERFTYFLLIASKVLSSFLDLAGIAVIGLLVGLGSASLSHGNSFSIAGMTFPAPTPETFAALAIFVLVLFEGKRCAGDFAAANEKSLNR